MTNLSSHIVSLLVHRDCVIVPDFGAFLANPISARIKTTSHKFNPPGRRFSFNANLTQNDGLLINEIAISSGKSYDVVKGEIAAEVKDWKSKLEREKQLSLNQLGTLHVQANKSLRFAPDYSASNALSSFGLSAFHKIPVPKEATVESAAQTQAKSAFGTAHNIRSKQPVLKYVAAALALPIIGYSFYLTTQTGLLKSGAQFDLADLNPFTEKVCPEYSVRSEASRLKGESNAVEESLASITLTDGADPIPVKSKQIISNTAPIHSALNYHIIAGCFGEKSNAQKLVTRLKVAGFSNAQILDIHKGLHRVSTGGFETELEASNTMELVREEFSSGAWLLHKE